MFSQLVNSSQNNTQTSTSATPRRAHGIASEWLISQQLEASKAINQSFLYYALLFIFFQLCILTASQRHFCLHCVQIVLIDFSLIACTIIMLNQVVNRRLLSAICTPFNYIAPNNDEWRSAEWH